MSQPSPRRTKKQKKALAFRTRQRTAKAKDRVLDEDALDFPIDENQDLAGLAGFPLEVEEVSGGDRSRGREGKAQDVGHHQAQPESSKKRKREAEDAVEEKPGKRTKGQPLASESGVDDDNCQKTVEVTKEVQHQRFILFIGTLRSVVRRMAHPPRL